MKISKGSWHYKIAEKTQGRLWMYEIRTPCSYTLLVLRGIFKTLFNKLVSVLTLLGWVLAHVVLFASIWSLFFTKIETLSGDVQWMFILGMSNSLSWTLIAVLVYFTSGEYIGPFAMSKKYRTIFKFTDKHCGTIEYID